MIFNLPSNLLGHGVLDVVPIVIQGRLEASALGEKSAGHVVDDFVAAAFDNLAG